MPTIKLNTAGKKILYQYSLPTNIQSDNLQPKDLPSTIINLQNATVASNSQGVGNLIHMISKGDLFRANTGLNQYQRNALAAIQAAFNNAQFQH